MKRIFALLLAFAPLGAFATDVLEKDTLFTELRNDVVVLSSTKETNSLKSLPAAVSVFSPKNLEGLQVKSVKDISAIVPNFFIPNYGSKMTTPLYIRGIGARSGAQTVSLYIDNIPYFNPSVFDSELYDIQRIEVLRGTQGTLYGRNAMGGIINIYTFSPLTHEQTNAMVSSGNYGYFSGYLSHYTKLKNNLGLAASGYYKRDNGFFENAYTRKKADNSENAGGRIKLHWEITPNFSAQYSTSFDFNNQGAFPYMNIDSTKVNYDGTSSYKRHIITNGISLQYTNTSYIINSTTGYQYLNDNMNMDQDYSPLPVFRINQKQNQHSLSEELTIKSNTKLNYQWTNGIFGFYDYKKITTPVTFLQYGIANMLQKPFDKAAAANPNIPIIKIQDSEIDMPGTYRKPVYGVALFHQSTFKNILYTEGLSFTAGLRLDYENTNIKYNAYTGANATYQPQNLPGIPPSSARVDTIIQGKSSKDYVELLPRFVLKYDLNPNSYIYVSASRGYKTGGHNEQVFADLLSGAFVSSIMSRGKNQPSTTSINDMISYGPEYSWTYEIGGQIDIIKNSLSTNFAIYYIDVKDVQITQFAQSGAGRMTTNAGKAVSKGFELGLKARPCTGFYLFANYGFTDARFKSHEYNMNKHIPFAPEQTFSIGTSITRDIQRNKLLDRILLDVNYSGAGRIYWNESNTLSQAFYGTVNARLAFEKNIFSLEFWSKNIFDKNYQAFYFESMGNSFVQKGKPIIYGTTLRIKI